MTRRTFVRHASLFSSTREPPGVRRSGSESRTRSPSLSILCPSRRLPNPPVFGLPRADPLRKFRIIACPCGRLRANCIAIFRPLVCGATAPHRPVRRLKRAAARRCSSNGPTNCRPNISCRSTTACTAPKPTSPRCAAWCMFTAPRLRPKATAIPRIGTFRESRAPISIPTRRTPPRFGITTTPWASTG